MTSPEEYEKVIAKNPQDDHSRKRLNELKDLMAPVETRGDREPDKVRQKKERMIAILEAWLANLQEKANTPLTVT